MHALGLHPGVVGGEIIAVQEEAHPAAGLITDSGRLFGAVGLRQQDLAAPPFGATTTQRLGRPSSVSEGSSFTRSKFSARRNQSMARS